MRNHVYSNNRFCLSGGLSGGFTLVEVLVSVLVLGIMVIAALQFFSLALACDNKAHRTALAAALLQNEIEYIRTQGGIDYVNDKKASRDDTTKHYYDAYQDPKTLIITGIVRPETAQSQSLPGCMPNYKIVMTYDPNFNTAFGLKKITGTISWNHDTKWDTSGDKQPYIQLNQVYTVMTNRQKHVGG